MKRAWLLFLLSAFLALPANAGDFTWPAAVTLWSFQDGVHPTAAYTGCEDAWISEANPTFNYGADDRILLKGAAGGVTRQSGLIKFDIAAISDGELVIAAQMGIYQADGATAATTPQCQIRRFLFPWVEGTADGAPQAGSATWNSAGSANWTKAGAHTGAAAPYAGTSPLNLGQFWTTNIAADSDTSVTTASYVGSDTLTGYPVNAHADDSISPPYAEWFPKGGATDIPRRTRGWVWIDVTHYYQRIHEGANRNHGHLLFPDPDDYGYVGLIEYWSSNYSNKAYRPILKVWTVSGEAVSDATGRLGLGGGLGLRP